MVIMSWSHEPLEQLGFFLVCPVLGPCAAGVFVRIDGLFRLAPALRDMAGQNIVCLFALHGRAGLSVDGCKGQRSRTVG